MGIVGQKSQNLVDVFCEQPLVQKVTFSKNTNNRSYSPRAIFFNEKNQKDLDGF
jgi:hypothetical protein